MLHFVQTLLLCFFTLFLSAQCDLPFGDFENYDDLTAEINESADLDLPLGTLLTPMNLIPLFRIWELNEDSILLNTPIDELNTELFGFSRTDQSRNGDYALKIGGESSTGYTDLGGQFGCSNMATANYISFYYKHFGEEIDTLILQGVLGESFEFLFVDYEDPSIGAKFSTILSSDQDENEEWNWVQLPIIDNENGISLDTMIFIMARLGQPGSENYWLIDDFQWNIETPVLDIDDKQIFQLGQSLNSETLYINLDRDNYTFLSYQIFDAVGREIGGSQNIWEDQVNVLHLNKGTYFFQVQTDRGVFTKPFTRF